MNLIPLRASLVVAACYGYFLIFAQFSFVELLRAGGMGLHTEKSALGLMALAGVAAGFLTAKRGATLGGFRIAMALGALAAAMAPFASSLTPVLGIAVLTGTALGVATVSLSALLPAWCGLAWLGLGTGLGYACCNLPFVFQQSPSGQAWVGVVFALVGCAAAPSRTEWLPMTPRRVFPMWAAVLLFTAMVWLDSAAFFIIQHEHDLKSGTWGAGMLWRNAALHLLLAVLAGGWLAWGGARVLPVAAWILLAIAALAVNHEATRSLAGWLYPAGVSLYSTALVAWPAWFSGAAGPRSAVWNSAWLFAIAGWFGSANGIGMAESLHHVPPLFVGIAGAVILGVAVWANPKNLKAVWVAGAVVTIGLISGKPAAASSDTAAERGRRVYLAEGCIHCHSQYPRPGSVDELNWGPARGVKETLAGEPVLIGNRRQGPDLGNVGARRSEAWLKAHFMDPRALAPDSVMPSYAHLFKDGRGNDLVRYLKEAGAPASRAVMQTQAAWRPSVASGKGDGKSLFAKHCAACHGATGEGSGPFGRAFLRPPANLKQGPFIWSNQTDPAETELALARIIKFGIVGTDMPGHETLTDDAILSLVDALVEMRR